MDSKLVFLLLLITNINAIHNDTPMSNHQEQKVINSPTIKLIDTNENNRVYLIPMNHQKVQQRRNLLGSFYPQVFIIRPDSKKFTTTSDIFDATNIINHRARQINFNSKDSHYTSLVRNDSPRGRIYPYEFMTETGLLGVYPKSPSIGIVPAQEIVPVSTKTYVNPRGEEEDPEGLAEVYPGIFNRYRPMNGIPEKLIRKDGNL